MGFEYIVRLLHSISFRGIYTEFYLRGADVNDRYLVCLVSYRVSNSFYEVSVCHTVKVGHKNRENHAYGIPFAGYF